jgi:nucleoside-diphosphate-sugar epimerase
MRALVTGANGFVGAWLVQRLLARGDVVRCLIRGEPSPALRGAECVRGDITLPETLPAAVKDVDVVFHLAGIRRTPSRADFFQINAEGTRLVCEAMVKAGARRMVLVSSLAASGPGTLVRPKREEDPFEPAEWYGESKVEAERVALSFQDRLEVAISRPSRIVGPGDKENLAFFKLVKRGIRLVIGGAPRPISFVDVDDVVDLLLLLGERKEAVGEAFFSTAEAFTVTQLLDEVARVLGRKTRTLYLPPFALRGLAAIADVISQATGRHLPLNRKLASQLLVPAWTCSGEKATRLLGHMPKRSIPDSVRRTAEWYLREGWL